ncbi:hypothetical protein AB0L64_06055 [Kribbella sp. NPDC051936]|uniref:hypothetical protein n=1 Tax=Kribbella sp. NPDC051936 TaxID=3154946 RepID=UPI0034213AF9
MMGRYRLVWYPARVSMSREHPGKTHIVDEFYYGRDERPYAKLLCTKNLTARYWTAAKCREQGLHLENEPSRTAWPTCDRCRGNWFAILESTGQTVEDHSYWWSYYWEEEQGLRPTGETDARLAKRDNTLLGQWMYPSLRSGGSESSDSAATETQRVTVAVLPIVSDVAFEAQFVDTFPIESREPTTALRNEAKLVQRYAEALDREGSTATRKQIKLTDVTLYTDLFDSKRAELVEAKATASREAVRYAIGQLLDYQRYVGPESLAILVPTRPSPDMIELLHNHQITCIVEDSAAHFTRLSP